MVARGLLEPQTEKIEIFFFQLDIAGKINYDNPGIAMIKVVMC